MLVRLAQHEFGKLQHGFSRVTAICNWIRNNVEYLRGSTNPLTSAYDTATERAGVCRDFAHLAIAFCRALLIPARFVAGYAYALQQPDFHAYFEAYLDGAWYIFDPTRLAPQTGLIRIGTGHDAADTSFATIFVPRHFHRCRSRWNYNKAQRLSIRPRQSRLQHRRTGNVPGATCHFRPPRANHSQQCTSGSIVSLWFASRSTRLGRAYHFLRYLYFYRILLRLNAGAVSVRVNLSKLCAKEKNLRGVIDPQ